eukprot:7228031-Lingulodinium_polyedra.AAC.1
MSASSGGLFPQPKSAKSYERERMGRYLLAARRQFDASEAGPFFSLAQDGTRVSGLDMLFTCLYSPPACAWLLAAPDGPGLSYDS